MSPQIISCLKYFLKSCASGLVNIICPGNFKISFWIFFPQKIKITPKTQIKTATTRKSDIVEKFFA